MLGPGYSLAGERDCFQNFGPQALALQESQDASFLGGGQCGRVVAPTISSLACQEQLIDAAKGVAHSVEGIVEAAQQSCHDDKLLADLGAAAPTVTQALNDLLQHIKKGAGPTAAGESHEDAVDTILTVTDRLFSSVGDAHEMVRQARQLAQATSSLVGAIRGEAEGHSDSDMQKRLLAAARQLADATANMVEAAKIRKSCVH
uniref:Talin-1/2 VBS2 domain-containing protein n=1 Tax=Magallana gigas TaxID=29159 RepID=A0A8W8NSY0_MAGGI